MAVTITVRTEGAPNAAEARDDSLALTFDMPRVFIGRGEGSDFRLPDPSVSPRHASLRQRGHEYVIVDEGSTNGTALASVVLPPQSPRVVRSGDLIRVGRVWIEITIDPLATARATPAAAKALALELVSRGLAAQGEESAPRLVVESGPDAGKSLELTETTRRYVIGRARDVDLSLEDTEAAWRHVEVGLKGDHLVVKDLGSKGATLEATTVGPNDVAWKVGQTLTLGKNVLVFEYPAASALNELSRSADEPMRPGEAPPPPRGAEPEPEPENTPEASSTETPAPKPLRPQHVTTTTPEPGWSLTDGVVLIFAAFVLVASIVGFFWLIRR